MGLVGEVILGIMKFFAKLLGGGIAKGLLPIALVLFFCLLGLIFLSWAALDVLAMLLPSYQAKLVLAIIFFVLAAIFKLRW